MRVVSSGAHSGSSRAFLEHIAIPLLCLFIVVLFTGLFFSALTTQGKPGDNWSTGEFSCKANGNVGFPWHSGMNMYWDPQLFLSITLASGNLTFSQAKAIDIIWDLVVGRGGQLLFSLLAYSVVRKSLLASLERKPIRMPVVTSLVFEHGSCWSMWRVLQDLTKDWSWKLFAYWWIITYLLAFGTIVSAMTGYQANMSPYYIEEGTASLMPYNEVTPASGVRLEDGGRVGLAPNTLVLDVQSDHTYPLYNYSQIIEWQCSNSLMNTSNEESGTFSGQYDTGSFSIQWTIDVKEDQASGMNYPNSLDTSSDYHYIKCTTSNVTLGNQSYTLPAPPLSFTGAYAGDYYGSTNNVFLGQDGKVLDRAWLEKNSQCQIQTTYEWGFSSLLLFSFCIVTILYACTLLALHIEVWYMSQTNRILQDFSTYRDILDFAAEIKSAVGEKAEDIPAKDLEQHTAIRDGPVSVSAYEYPASRQQMWHRSDGQFKTMLLKLKAGHEYSKGEMKRSLGMAYGPIPLRRDTSDLRIYEEA